MRNYRVLTVRTATKQSSLTPLCHRTASFLSRTVDISTKPHFSRRIPSHSDQLDVPAPPSSQPHPSSTHTHKHALAEPPPPLSRTIPMEVLSLGMPRTGTACGPPLHSPSPSHPSTLHSTNPALLNQPYKPPSTSSPSPATTAQLSSPFWKKMGKCRMRQ